MQSQWEVLVAAMRDSPITLKLQPKEAAEYDVSVRLEPSGDGTRLTWEHTGFTGVDGFVVSRILGSVRRKMLREWRPAVLAAEAG